MGKTEPPDNVTIFSLLAGKIFNCGEVQSVRDTAVPRKIYVSGPVAAYDDPDSGNVTLFQINADNGALQSVATIYQGSFVIATKGKGFVIAAKGFECDGLPFLAQRLKEGLTATI